MRSVQIQGKRGSLKWIQSAVEQQAPALNEPILQDLTDATKIDWLSPLRDDAFAEYRDEAFLTLLGLSHLTNELRRFWPQKGPQWDALGRTDSKQVLLVEAKAHIGEFCSPGSEASEQSLLLIRSSLEATASELGVSPDDAKQWHRKFYQYTNRLAHLSWLVRHGVDAHLVLVGFCGDADMPGDTTRAAWVAAYKIADFALGLPKRHHLQKRIIHVYPDVRELAVQFT